MFDFAEYLGTLRRPKLLIAAATHAAADQRLPALRRSLFRLGLNTNSAAQLLVVEEQSLNERRTCGDASYPLSAHVVVLAALLRQASFTQTHLSSNLCVAA